MTAPLTLADIADVRAYERERPAFRAAVIELKRRRRVALGPVVSVVFEHRDTVRFQVQEMARAEGLVTDAAIQHELDTYNPMVPGPGWCCASVLVELTTPEEVREWLRALVGIERHLVLRLPGDAEVRGVPADRRWGHRARPDVTAAVHLVRFDVTADALVGGGPGADAEGDVGVVLASDHPAYAAATTLPAATVAELVADVAGGPVPPSP